MTLEKQANRLIHEASPYLLQHAHNPVNWYPWGEEAFRKAKAEDKPIFLSIGYSTCHWCHVMERESFEREGVATLMNEAFVNIKVDREERPDIDNVYMSVCQILTGSGGWPLSIIMTPEQKPFFAGTYIPRNSQHGRLGMVELIPKIEILWETKRDNVLKSAEEIGELLQKNELRKWQSDIVQPQLNNNKDEINSILKRAYQDLEYAYDNRMGGFGGAPKFPTPHRLLYLMRYWKETKNYDALSMVNTTLNQMRMGGIYDQIGFGFHRYSTDQNWLLPHFEKMLYDQSLMIIVYLEAYQATKEEKHKETAQEIITYVMRDLTDESGAFYSAEDADSEGEEGKFYVWTEQEINQTLGDKADYAKKFFGVEREGNFNDESTGKKSGKNILHLDHEDKLVMIDKSKVSSIQQILLKEREKRIRPSLDDKILVDWNGLMITALAMAGRVLNHEEYIVYAEKACGFILNSIHQNDKIMHRYCKGKWDITGHLDDYAFFICGLIELYQATFNETYLQEATILTEKAIDLFWDNDTAGFFFTSKEGEKLIVRKKEIYDGAIPSGNSVMLNNLLKLTSLQDNEIFTQKANDMIQLFYHEINDHPTGYTQMLCGIYYAYGDSGEITIKGDPQSNSTKQMVHSIFLEYLPNIIMKIEDEKGAKPMATLCYNKACRQPTNNVNDIIQQLQ